MVKLCRLGEVLSFDELLGKINALEKRLSPSSSGQRMQTGEISDPGRDWGVKEDETPGPETTDKVPEGEDWKGFLNHLAAKNGAMANVLTEWRFLRITGDTLEIAAGGNPFTASYLNEPEKTEKLARYCRDFFKRDLKIKVVNDPVVTKTAEEHLEEEKVKPNKKKHSDLPQPVQDVLQIFQGEIKE